MNIEQARGSVGKSVLCFNHVLSDKVFWIKEVHENFHDGKWFYNAVIEDSTGKTYSVGLDEIDFLPEHELVVDMSPLHRELRKEISFALIQQGQIVDSHFKDKVDTVFDAITS